MVASSVPFFHTFRHNLIRAPYLLLPGLAVALTAIYLIFLNPVIDYRSDQKSDAVHLLYLTQSLAETGTYPSRHWPPGLAMLFAPVWLLFGLNLHVLKLGIVLMGLGTAWISYLWYRFFMGRIAAALLALSVASAPLFFDYSHRFLTEIPFVFWLVLFLYLITLPIRPGSLALLGRCALLVLAGAMAQLTRGNGTLLLPALVLAAFSFKRPQSFPLHDRLGRTGALILLAIVSLPSLLLFASNALHDYPGIHGSTYLEELLASDSDDVWLRTSRYDAPPIETVSAADFARRIYSNVFWAQNRNYPAVACSPVAMILDGLPHKPLLEWAVILPVWALLAAGIYRLFKQSPVAFWFLLLNAVLLLAWPWPWGAHRRFLLPLVPVLALLLYFGSTRVMGENYARVLLGIVVLINFTALIQGAWQQADEPYASAEFANIVKLIESVPEFGSTSEPIVIDDGIARLPEVLIGRPSMNLSNFLKEWDSGQVRTALVLLSPETSQLVKGLEAAQHTPVGMLVIQPLQVEGNSSIVRASYLP